MPTYKFMCPKCAKTLQEMVKITATKGDFPKCPECGTPMNKTWITPEGGFILKGPGWFKKGGY